jgi:hypothetical protein
MKNIYNQRHTGLWLNEVQEGAGFYLIADKQARKVILWHRHEWENISLNECQNIANEALKRYGLSGFNVISMDDKKALEHSNGASWAGSELKKKKYTDSFIDIQARLIILNPMQLDPVVVMHQCAHAVTQQFAKSNETDHGPLYVRIFIDMSAHYKAKDSDHETKCVKFLEAQADQLKIKYSKKQRPAPLPELAEALIKADKEYADVVEALRKGLEPMSSATYIYMNELLGIDGYYEKAQELYNQVFGKKGGMF